VNKQRLAFDRLADNREAVLRCGVSEDTFLVRKCS